MTQLATIQGERALATSDAHAMPLSLLPVGQMQAVLAEYDERRLSFRAWLLSKMTEGVHYGTPPGCAGDSRVDPRQWKSRPSLYKAGADLLCDLLMLDPTFDPDAETWRMLGSHEGQVVIRCRLVSRGTSPFYPDRPKGEVIGEGRGVGQSGVKKRDGNGAVKIAQKSAKVDAIINTLGISDLFTQDQEPPTPQPAPIPDASAPKVGTREERRQVGERVNAKQLGAMLNEWGRLGLCKREASSYKGKEAMTEFCKWVQSQLQTDTDFSSVGNWTINDADRIGQILGEIASGS